MSRLLPVAFFGGSAGGGEILLILVVVLLLFGARKLPGMARSLGKALEEFRRAARDVQDEIMRGDSRGAARPKEPAAGDTQPKDTKDGPPG